MFNRFYQHRQFSTALKWIEPLQHTIIIITVIHVNLHPLPPPGSHTLFHEAHCTYSISEISTLNACVRFSASTGAHSRILCKARINISFSTHSSFVRISTWLHQFISRFRPWKLMNGFTRPWASEIACAPHLSVPHTTAKREQPVRFARTAHIAPNFVAKTISYDTCADSAYNRKYCGAIPSRESGKRISSYSMSSYLFAHRVSMTINKLVEWMKASTSMNTYVCCNAATKMDLMNSFSLHKRRRDFTYDQLWEGIAT